MSLRWKYPHRSIITIGLFFLLTVTSFWYVRVMGWECSLIDALISLWSITQQRKKRRMIDSLQVMTVFRHFSCSLAYDTYAFHFYYHLTNCDCRLTERPFFFDCTYTNKHTHSIIDVKILSHKQKSNVYRIIPWQDFVDGI